MSKVSGVIVAYSDGACVPNPGQASWGAVLYSDLECKNVLCEIGGSLGDSTNNVAEYTGAVEATKKAIELGPPAMFRLCVDSLLVAQQVKGEWAVKKSHLAPLHASLKGLLESLPNWEIVHVRRRFNAHADRLAGDILRQGKKKEKEG
jgi:ribonuclease HI